MTIEVICPACKSGYVLEGGAAGSEFHCPSCSHVSRVEPARPTAARPAVRRAARTTVMAAAEASTRVAAPIAAPAATAAAPPAGGPRTEIVCPRCDLHFSPEKHTFEVRPGDRPGILLVEDEGYSRDATAEALAGVYDVVTAGTVDAAARILALGGIDLMILDLDIDHGFGRRLLRREALKPCPIVIYVNDESRYYGAEWEALRDQGADAMVIKGMNAAEAVVRKVGELLGRTDDDEDTLTR